MNASLHKLLVFTAITFCSSVAFGAENEPGGEGFVKSHAAFPDKGEVHCFPIRENGISEICATYKINWKLWTLMGEPVVDYNLEWTLNNIRLSSNVEYSKTSQLPKPLQAAANAIELYIDGVLNIDTPSDYYTMLNLPFNTGVPVRANVGTSMNVPGSPSWDTLFTENELCNIKERKYISAEKAKLAVKDGIEIVGDFLNCRDRSSMSATSLISAIDDFCEDEKMEKTEILCRYKRE